MHEIDWSVVSSGVDFLESAVNHLAGGTERDLRYAALHLSTALETLLKAQLARADWELVFENVKKADRIAYQTGAFRSVGITEALRRLRKHTSSSITEEEERRIRLVADVRNRVAHFALHGEDPRRTEATLARALDVLLHFIDREFAPAADANEAKLVEGTLERVRERLGKIQALIRERMETLRPALTDAVGPVLACPGCAQPAYVLGDGEPGRCLYCLHHPDGDIAASEYIGAVLGLSYYETAKEGGQRPVHNCVECGDEAFVLTGDPGDAVSGETIWVCFACGYFLDEMGVAACVDCGIMAYRATDGLTVCENCTAKFFED